MKIDRQSPPEQKTAVKHRRPLFQGVFSIRLRVASGLDLFAQTGEIRLQILMKI